MDIPGLAGGIYHHDHRSGEFKSLIGRQESRGDEPPLPVLSEPARAEARAGEQRFINQRFFRPWLSPPIPDTTLNAANSWRLFVDTLAVDATAARTAKPVLQKKPVVPTRSPFRQGVLVITKEGFTLRGVGTHPIPWLQRLSTGSYVVATVLLFLSYLQIPQWIEGILYTVCGLSFVVGLVSYTVASILSEIRRIPHEIQVPWDSLVEAQFESEMHWAVFLYRAPSTKPGVPGKAFFFSLNHLTPAFAGALWDTVEHYAPGRVRPSAGVYDWTINRKIAALALIGGLINGTVLLIYFITRSP